MADIKIKSFDGKEFSAYSAMPTGKHGAVIIVIQEIFGVNANMRKICDDFAAQGYIAVCPDLFWRRQPGVQLTDKTPEEWDHAMDLMKGFDTESGVRDLLSVLAYVRAMPGCSGKVGAIGFCLGGKMAYLMATRSDVDASIGYYGVELEKYTDEVQDIRMPLMLHIAGLDKYTPPPVRERLLKTFSRNPVISAYIYDKADHAFARIGGEHYNPEAANLASERSQKFFAEYLRS